MFAEERQNQIAAMLAVHSSIKVTELSETFRVSESTIRRDLQEMEEKNLLKRTHGGAVGLQKRTFEPSFKVSAAQGSHTGEVMQELGYSPEQIEAYLGEGAVVGRTALKK